MKPSRLSASRVPYTGRLLALFLLAGMLNVHGDGTHRQGAGSESRLSAPANRRNAVLPGPLPDGVRAVETIHEPLPMLSRFIRPPREGERIPPLRVLLSRERYWAQDGHLDAVVQLDPAALTGDVRDTSVRCRIRNAAGDELAAFSLAPPGERFIVYPEIPEALLGGGAGELEVVWNHPDGKSVRQSHGFRVASQPETFPEAGGIAVHVYNDEGVVERGVPFTLGIPFPRGALYDVSNLRLVAVDRGREEIPLQAAAVARWSKFGSVKWVHVDFTVDLPGTARQLELEYGPGVSRRDPGPVPVEKAERFPAVEAGRLRFADGLWFDAEGNGDYIKVLDERGLSGAFVEHEDGRVYRMRDAGGYTIEESGPEKVVLRREGWYAQVDGDAEFCSYITRFIIHRDSPLMRIFHSWIFTGDGNRDRIRNMGWEFSMPQGFEPAGFLTSFGEEGAWVQADTLLQWDYEHFDMVAAGDRETFPGGRAPGVAAAQGGGVRMYFGARDFWQNYPSELEFSAGSLWFHNWPRHNRPAGYTLDGDLITASGEPALPSAARHAHYEEGRLTRSEWSLNVIQARFAHEGELLDFRLPDALAADPIWNAASRGREFWSAPCDQGKPETANAQGISRTEEMWLYFVPEAEEGFSGKERLLRGLNAETLRAVADPVWVSASGAFHEMHHRDPGNYPEEERVFDLITRAPGLVKERLGIYGMWVFGGLPAYAPGLATREPGLYRAYRKRHQGWPYRWEPFARSGDPELLRLADQATRQMIDATYVHYYSADVDERSGPTRYRRKGFRHRSVLPWASGGPSGGPPSGPVARSYSTTCDYLWHAWYLRGYHRAKDNALCWALQTKDEDHPGAESIGRGAGRVGVNLLQAYLNMYEATFDPWFLAAVRAIGDAHVSSRHFTTKRIATQAPGSRNNYDLSGFRPLDFMAADRGNETPARTLQEDGVRTPAPDPTVRAFRTASEIDIDGRLDERAWEDAHPLETFFVWKSRAGFVEEHAKTRTSARLLYDEDKNLYAGFESTYAPGVPGDSRVLEHVEILLRPPVEENGSVRFVRLVVGADGTVDQLQRRTSERDPDRWIHDADWALPEHGLKTAIAHGPERWTAEMKIALPEISPADLRGWKVNLSRFTLLADAHGDQDLPKAARPFVAHFWRAGPRDYLRFTGCSAYRDYYLAYADSWGHQHKSTSRINWVSGGCPMIESNAYAWRLTGDAYYLRRLAAEVDWTQAIVMDTDDYRRGQLSVTGMTRYHAWYMQYFPLALAAFEAAGDKPAPIHGTFVQGFEPLEEAEIGAARYGTPAIFLRKEKGQALPLFFSGTTDPSAVPEGELFDYRVIGPGGAAVLSGSFPAREPCSITLPAEAPPGTYRLYVQGNISNRSTGIEVPVSPPDTPEVIAWQARGFTSHPADTGNTFVQYWFLVPEGTTDFFVEYTRAGPRVSIWGPDGERAWDSQRDLDDSGPPFRAAVDVRPDQAGRLWRITLPGGLAARYGFTVDPRIPPLLAVCPQRWFLPDQVNER